VYLFAFIHYTALYCLYCLKTACLIAQTKTKQNLQIA